MPKKDKEHKNEQVIWDMYQEKCKQEGKEPTVDDFKEWTKALLKGLG